MKRLTIEERIIERLWKAASEYESQYISGSAIGLVTAGVLQNKPKCLAVAAWQGAIWDEYYARKALVLSGAKNINMDFSSFGGIPHPVPELKQEIFG